MSEQSRLVRMTIKNIGCIGGDGLTVELDNIVCLVGANNTGKSTVLRAYEAAVNQLPLSASDLNLDATGSVASVELWVHIPAGTANIDEKWKEADGNLLLVRSRWEWPTAGGKPSRTTWDPVSNEYAEDGKASGLDNVFNSRRPKPFRIGALENPAEEHKKLLTLVLEPVANKLKGLMEQDESPLRKILLALQEEAEKPVAEFRNQIEEIETRVNNDTWNRLPTLLTVDELAKLTRLNRKTGYEGIRQGDVPGAIRIGRSIRITRSAVLTWLRQVRGPQS